MKPHVRREGEGESSIIRMGQYRMTQTEARALVNALLKVTFMPPDSAGRRTRAGG